VCKSSHWNAGEINNSEQTNAFFENMQDSDVREQHQEK
jgi:hypothetical protein